MNATEKLILSWLEDEESRFIYKKRLEYNEKHDFNAIQEIVDMYVPECKDTPYRPEQRLELVEALRDKNKIIIFGAGTRGMRVLSLLQENGINVDCIVDNDSEKWGRQLYGLEIEQPDKQNYRDTCCIISQKNKKTISDVYKQLINLGAKDNNIFKYEDYNTYNFLEDKQYFDEKILKFEKSEVFIDAGVFDLHTSKEFIKRCENYNVENYKIYAFEPDKDSYRRCQGIQNELTNADIQLYNCGLWSEDTTLYFVNNGTSSRITSEKMDNYIDVVSLDSCIKDNVTFIKMDIEGAELEALRGGTELIKKNKPKLAISIYHKKEDLTEIPLLIKKLVPEYKLYIRHYSNVEAETVLYAVI